MGSSLLVSVPSKRCGTVTNYSVKHRRQSVELSACVALQAAWVSQWTLGAAGSWLAVVTHVEDRHWGAGWVSALSAGLWAVE